MYSDLEPQTGFIRTGMERFAFQDECYPRTGRNIAAAQKHLAQRPYDVYQANQVHVRKEMIIHAHHHEVKREHAKFEFDGLDHHGRKWRLGARERQEEIMNIKNHDMVFQQIAKMDEKYGRKWRVAAHQQKREDMVSNQNHQAKTDRLADIVFQEHPAPLMKENPGRKWRFSAQQLQAKQSNYNYYQSDQSEQQPYIYEVKKPVLETEETVMDAFEAARLHGGVLFIDYAARK